VAAVTALDLLLCGASYASVVLSGMVWNVIVECVCMCMCVCMCGWVGGWVVLAHLNIPCFSAS
jgi:hypothetical protein